MAGSLNLPSSFPGMIQSSSDLMRKWLGLYQTSFLSFDYNVRVGQGIAPPAYLTDQEKALWKKLTQKRIDCVAERPGETWIIEVMERPGLAAVGQLIGYQHLYAAYEKVPEKFVAALVCARLGRDMRLIFQNQGVIIFQFPPAGIPVLPPSFLPSYAGSAFTTP